MGQCRRADRAVDYQVWCGPAMGAFNEWTRGTWLEKPENRSAPEVAMNLMLGACELFRFRISTFLGSEIVGNHSPKPLSRQELAGYLQAGVLA